MTDVQSTPPPPHCPPLIQRESHKRLLVIVWCFQAEAARLLRKTSLKYVHN